MDEFIGLIERLTPLIVLLLGALGGWMGTVVATRKTAVEVKKAEVEIVSANVAVRRDEVQLLRDELENQAKRWEARFNALVTDNQEALAKIEHLEEQQYQNMNHIRLLQSEKDALLQYIGKLKIILHGVGIDVPPLPVFQTQPLPVVPPPAPVTPAPTPPPPNSARKGLY